MPMPNFHAARISEPSKFEEGTFRTKEIAPGIVMIMGKEKDGNGSMVTESVHFDSSKFTAAEAKAWMESHKMKFISFEAATSSKNEVFSTTG